MNSFLQGFNTGVELHQGFKRDWRAAEIDRRSEEDRRLETAMQRMRVNALKTELAVDAEAKKAGMFLLEAIDQLPNDATKGANAVKIMQEMRSKMNPAVADRFKKYTDQAAQLGAVKQYTEMRELKAGLSAGIKEQLGYVPEGLNVAELEVVATYLKNNPGTKVLPGSRPAMSPDGRRVVLMGDVQGLAESNKRKALDDQALAITNKARVDDAIQRASNAYKLNDDQRDQGRRLSEEFRKSKEFKDYLQASSDIDTIRSLSTGVETGAKDLALIFKFMKTLDPGSVVREGEFQTAAEAAGWLNMLENKYSKLKSGEFLDPQSRGEFVRAAEIAVKSLKTRAKGLNKAILGQARKDGIPEEFFFDAIPADAPVKRESITVSGDGGSYSVTEE